MEIEATEPLPEANKPVGDKKVRKKHKKQVAAEAAGDMAEGTKSHRKRKRHHYNAVRAQMEFYFGDANLTKDRYLKQLIDQDPYVPLEVFLNFNKLKALTNSVETIAKSLSNSQLLEVNETQTKVRRKTEIPVERNVDDKTLYVEALPAAADHDWVRQAFERFGPVVYVSLPKYAKSRKIKEFGFIEFEQEGSVEKAIQAFQEFNGVLRMQEADPGELQSVKSFIKEQNEETETDAGVKKETDSEQKKVKKTKRNAEEAEHSDGPETKKPKTEKEEQSTATETGDSTTNDEGDEKQKQIVGEDGSAKKKRRKKKKKSKNLEKRKNESDLNTDASFYELKILPKRDWKRLRNKYLNLQREKVAELKRKAWKERQQQQQQQQASEVSAGGTDTSENAPSTPAKKQKPNQRKLRKMNMNFYGAGEEDAKPQPKEIKHNPALERTPLFTYAEGLIVEVGFLKPCTNVKEFKADMRQYEAVKYVDVKEGAMHAHLRLDTAEAALEFVRQVSCAEYNCKLLSGEAELGYWKKIEADREMKLNKQVKVPQKRGREKVKKLITKHIHFGEEDE